MASVDGNQRIARGGENHQEVLDAPPSRTYPIASRGLRSTKDVKQFLLAAAEDVILGSMAPRSVSTAVSAISATLRTVQLEMRHAENLQPVKSGGLDLLADPHEKSIADNEKENLQRLIMDAQKRLQDLNASGSVQK